MCEIKLFFGLLIISWFKFKFMAYYFIQKKAECVSAFPNVNELLAILFI